MTQLTIQQVPRNGIGGYALPNEYIQKFEQEELSDFYQDGGISNLKPITDRLTEFGRFGDNAIAHVEKGELIVPYKLFENNPELKESIFSHLREMGIEDPERYVVGSEFNSINPETGLPEFFFKSVFKAISKPFKAAAKVVKKVAKVFKKIAPIVLPIALGMTPLGPIYGAALGSGIGSLMNGGSLKDAFKAAIISGGTGALFSGAKGAMQGKDFFGSIKTAAAAPGARFSQFGKALTGIPEKGIGSLFQGYSPTGDPVQQTKISTGDVKTSPAEIKADALVGGGGQNTTITNVGDSASLASKSADSLQLAGDVAKAPTERGFFGKTMDVLTGAEPSRDAVLTRAAEINTELASKGLEKFSTTDAIASATKELSPGFLRTYGPTAALGAGALALGGAFKVPEQEVNTATNLTNSPSGADLLASNPTKFGLPASAFLQQTAQGPFGVGTDFPFTPTTSSQTNPFLLAQGTQIAATGGEIYPRRIGGIMPDEGVPNEDSVRALLTPGEFVMTTDAVKGLGNGNPRQGINNMYALMDSLETKGRRMA
jgi:hypothetical protein